MTRLGGMPKSSSEREMSQPAPPPDGHPRSTCCPFDNAASQVASVLEKRYDARSPTTAAPAGAVKTICASVPCDVPADWAGIELRATSPASGFPPVGHWVYAVIQLAVTLAAHELLIPSAASHARTS